MTEPQNAQPTEDQIRSVRYAVEPQNQIIRVKSRARVELVNGRIEAHAAYFEEFNQHNDYYQRGAFSSRRRGRRATASAPTARHGPT